VIRHSTAHLLAYAVKELFPDAQVTIGPVIDNGFYYDFSYKRPFTPEDLVAIEKKMAELAKKDEPVTQSAAARRGRGLLQVDRRSLQGRDHRLDPADQDVSLYSEGNFTDLCRGPHVPSTGKLKVFKLMKLAGAYWRGDSKNEMLQRLRHRLGQEGRPGAVPAHAGRGGKARPPQAGQAAGLVPLQDEAPGLVFWHPKGWTIWQQVEQYMRNKYQVNGYQEVKAPQILDASLWGRPATGTTTAKTCSPSRKTALRAEADELPGPRADLQQQYAFYRDLPLRYGEFGQCHRNEPSGALHGIMRVRGFTQDDGHIFCTEEQIQPEVVAFHTRDGSVSDFGFHNIEVKLALRPDNRIGSDESGTRPKKRCAPACVPAA
jgi:threonyl-tRNA synthetase